MKPPTVLIYSHDPAWRGEVKATLASKYEVLDKHGAPSAQDLDVKDGPPPDVVLWRLDSRGPISEAGPHLFQQWGPITKFVLLRYREGTWPLVHTVLHRPHETLAVLRFWLKRWLLREPLPGRLLGPRSRPEDVVAAVDSAAAVCWWSQWGGLNVPACQLSPDGRVLRVNDEMRKRFGPDLHNTCFRESVEQAGGPEFPDSHPVAVALRTGRASQDYVECGGRRFIQYVCHPDQFDAAVVRTVSVLVSDEGNRARVFDFARAHEHHNLGDIYRYIVDCAQKLGYGRARLYRLSADGKDLVGVASCGFIDRAKEAAFEAGFRMPVEEDVPSRLMLENPVPSLCILDPAGEQSAHRSGLVRVYRKRNYVNELELEGADRWIDAPLVVPGCNRGGPLVLGKLVVDRGTESHQLDVRDMLNVGSLAMMGAGSIHAFNQSHQEAELREKETFLNDLLEVLPLFAFEKDDRKFYRAVAAILSCHLGLRWEQVMLFIVDSSGVIKQASCEMALGGRGEPVLLGMREHLRGSMKRLRDYVQDALDNPAPDGDSLYQAWVSDKGDHRVVSFDGRDTPEGPVARALAGDRARPWLEIDVANDPWCRQANARFANTFAGGRAFAFPLSNSFTLDVFNARAEPTQPVGVALVGMTAAGGGGPESLGPHLTRVTIDLLGALIAQRWTGARIRGLFGSLSTIHHGKLTDSWERVRSAADRWAAQPGDDDRRKAHQAAAEEHEALVWRMQTAQATLKSLQGAAPAGLDLGPFLAQNAQRWQAAWGKGRSKGRLKLELGPLQAPLQVECEPLILGDVLTCLVENSVHVATARGREEVTVHVSARARPDCPDAAVEILVEDDAGGVNEDMVDWLFVKDVSGREGGQGRGLALARAELLMYGGDLQYVPTGEAGKASFRVLFRKRVAHGQVPAADRGQPGQEASRVV